MLILGRRVGDAVVIEGGIRIVVLAADGGGVRLGIEAPSAVGIYREEILAEVAEQNRRAGASVEQCQWLEVVTQRESARPPSDHETDATNVAGGDALQGKDGDVGGDGPPAARAQGERATGHGHP